MCVWKRKDRKEQGENDLLSKNHPPRRCPFALCVLTLENLVVDSSAGCGETIKNLTLPFLLFVVVVVVMCNIYRIFSLVNLYITISIRLIASRITNNTRNVIPCYV